MPVYEVRFRLRTDEEWTPNQITNVAHDVYARMSQRGWIPKPEDRKVYVQRILETHEEQAIVKKHAASDFAAGRDWNDPKKGCGCDTCKLYRSMNARIEP